MTLETETGVPQPQAKEPLEPAETAGGKEQMLLECPWRKCGPAETLISELWPPEL